MSMEPEKKKLILACTLLGLAVIVIIWNLWPSGSSVPTGDGAKAAPVVDPNNPPNVRKRPGRELPKQP